MATPHTSTSKGTQAVTPNSGKTWSYRGCVNGLRRIRSMSDPSARLVSAEPEEVGSRHMVRWLLSALGTPQSGTRPVLSEDLSALRRAVDAIVTAQEKDVLTEDEAEAVIRYMAERFASRRIDEVLACVTTPKCGSWFLVQGQERI